VSVSTAASPSGPKNVDGAWWQTKKTSANAANAASARMRDPFRA
jgi:hypothetical protein